MLYKYKEPSESTSTIPGYNYTISVLLHLLLGQDDFLGLQDLRSLFVRAHFPRTVWELGRHFQG